MVEPRTLTLADAVLPRKGLLVEVLLVLGASLFIALSAQVVIPLPFTPVPLTGQSFAVLLTGLLLGNRRGALAILAYLGEGMSGLPVFAGGGGSFAHLAGPTGGYLVAFVPAAFLTGSLGERGWDRRPVTAGAAMLLGSFVILGGGAAWLSIFTGAGKALTVGVLPFLPGDLLKTAAAAAIFPSAWKFLHSIR